MATPTTPFATPGEPTGANDHPVETRQLDTICLFDVDGTITLARQVDEGEAAKHRSNLALI